MNNDPKRPQPKSLWWSAASVILMVVGAFGPWAVVDGIFGVRGVTVRGTAGDGWIVIGAAAVAVVPLLFYARRRRRWLSVIAFLAAVVAAATAAYDINDLNRLSSQELFGSLVSPGWGLYAALAGSISLALSSIGLMIERRREAGADGRIAATGTLRKGLE